MLCLGYTFAGGGGWGMCIYWGGEGMQSEPTKQEHTRLLNLFSYNSTITEKPQITKIRKRVILVRTRACVLMRTEERKTYS